MKSNKWPFWLVCSLLFALCIFSLPATEAFLEDSQKILKLENFHVTRSAFQPGAFTGVTDFTSRYPIYSGTLLDPPGGEERIMYTFFTSFRMDSGLTEEQFSLYLNPSEYSGRIYLNGYPLTQLGSVRKDYDGDRRHPVSVYIPASLLHFGNNPNLLVCEVYPVQRESYPFSPIMIGEYNRVERAIFWRVLVGIGLSQITAGISIVVFFYLLFLFLYQGQRDYKLLWFALLCLAFIMAYANFSLTHNAANLILLDKISRVGLPLAVVFFFFFVLEYTKLVKKTLVIKLVFLGVAAINIALVLLQQDRYGIANIFSIFLNFFILPILLINIVLLVIALIKQKNPNTLIILGGMAAVIVTSLHDISHSNSKVVPYAWFVPLGFFGIVLSLFLVIALEQAATFKRSLRRAETLKKRNKEFIQLLKEITGVSESIDDASRDLDKSIQEASGVIGQYSRNNQQIASQIFEQFQHVEEMINRIQDRMATAINRIPVAINKQTTMVEKITTSLAAIDVQFDSSLGAFENSLSVAQNLYNIAAKSNSVNSESQQTITEILNNSSFLLDILSILEDLTEQTALLSINVSIEATRAGEAGKGFSVIAQEIRKLADKSKSNLSNSLKKIQEILQLIELSSVHSRDIATSLDTIVKESEHSASTVKRISGLIQGQKEHSADILQKTEELLSETHSIQLITRQEQTENEEIKDILIELKNSFQLITDALRQQEEQEGTLSSCLDQIKMVMADNQEHIQRLTLRTRREK